MCDELSGNSYREASDALMEIIFRKILVCSRLGALVFTSAEFDAVLGFRRNVGSLVGALFWSPGSPSAFILIQIAARKLLNTALDYGNEGSASILI